MSGPGAEHVQHCLLEPDRRAGYTWLTSGNRGGPNMSGLGVGHFRQMPLEPSLETRYVRKILASWIEERISMICTSPTHSMHPS
jgi:hypothetical protein